ncbi:MAG: chromosome segregation protein SMC [Alphaproteobacteria bacterium]|nr:chromosome segregation protein SMC [Alphaproteobacteria bacterium]
MHFTKLKLTGFKSFVENTELDIRPGLTGIVGPNGCGKSNLVEALRWVMGETSARQMRGGEMDDVIFGGTSDRPARNIAEVILGLDNADRTAPAEWNGETEIEIARRIERAHGSAYRVNGREVRARDVQLLFADQATGARSTALVSQGRVAALIAAKPADRRLLLEEAAGITGLHSRRHEAELRLRAAETNLARVDDVLATLDVQLQGLQRQARQARRYRKLSDLLRAAEAIVLHHRWTGAVEAEQDAKRNQALAEQAVALATRNLGQATTAREETATGLAPRRETEARAAAELQRLTIARGNLDAEERRLAEATSQATARAAQLAQDLGRERALAADAEAALQRLAGEREGLVSAQAGEAERLAAADTGLAERVQANEAAEAATSAIAGRIAAAEAERAALNRAFGELNTSRERLAARLAEIARERASLAAQGVDPAALAEAEAALEAADAALTGARVELDATEHARADAEAAREAARADRAATAQRLGKVAAERAALEALLGSARDGAATAAWPPLVDTVAVEPGWEAALGAALGDDLDAPADAAAPRHWRTLPALDAVPSLPGEATPLSAHVANAGPLGRVLAFTGIVADRAAGDRLVPSLHPGQRLVTRDGDLWRWDGYTAAAGGDGQAAVRLAQRNRLAALADKVAAAARLNETAGAALAEAEANAVAALDAERTARTARRDADTALGLARSRHDYLQREASGQAARAGALAEAEARAAEEGTDVDARLAEAEARRDGLADLDALRAEIEAARARLAVARDARREAEAASDALVREAQDCARRLGQLGGEENSWRERRDGAAQRIEALVGRETALAAERAELAGRPADLAERHARLMYALSNAERARGEAADAVLATETAFAEADKAMRAAEAILADAREARAHAVAATNQATRALAEARERIAERLDCPPAGALAAGGIEEGTELPALPDAVSRFERLQRERESMGPVNLRAEDEATTLDEQIATMRAEREDLTAAIARLRQGISTLNREARQRLVASFTEVDKHFRDLFERLFGGGHAHLALTESEDPLEAGLEIYASPPGKKLQSLSLLSGGEQALTAVALLFGVFLTNPAPICVLDEVDAPLDDANVDRFCSLLSNIARDGRTRFLLVTHHRLTMARMDRLYGVTMPERGVSQLVSVDLARAEELRATA